MYTRMYRYPDRWRKSRSKVQSESLEAWQSLDALWLSFQALPMVTVASRVKVGTCLRGIFGGGQTWLKKRDGTRRRWWRLVKSGDFFENLWKVVKMGISRGRWERMWRMWNMWRVWCGRKTISWTSARWEFISVELLMQITWVSKLDANGRIASGLICWIQYLYVFMIYDICGKNE